MFKKSFVNLKTKSALKKNAAARNNISFEGAREIGLIHHYSNDQLIQPIYHFFDQLEKQNKKVEVLVIKDRKDELNVPEFIIADTQDMTRLGKWTNEDVISYMNKEYDFLIHLNLEGSELVDNILANSKAKCRIGKYREEKQDYYELMISPEQDTIQKLIEQIYHYIQKL